MLKELKIENLAIIDNLDMDLTKGLTVLTGETGAGKSIILQGISMIIGEKLSKNMIGENQENVIVEAVFDINQNQIEKLEQLDYEFEEELIIYREFGKDNKIRIDGKRHSLGSLKEITTNILDIVGQHDHQYLLNSSYHLALLDKFILKETKSIKDEIKDVINKIKEIDTDIKKFEEEKKEILLRKDLYEISIKEIDEMKLVENEDESLEKEYTELFNSGMILEKISNINESFSTINLKNIKKQLEKLSKISDEYLRMYNSYCEIYEQFLDIINELNEKEDHLNIDPGKIEKVYDRISKINKLKFKYGPSINEINKISSDLKEKLNILSFSDEILNKKKEEKEKNILKYKELANNLSELRKNKANFLNESVKKELKELNMKDVDFKINIENIHRINENGIDDVKFLISTNKGESLKELSKIASGGEISRIMLALKIVFSEVDGISTLIFDEIDTGISGETVIKIANKLKELSKKTQIICVTHSPQIAAKADNQYLIYKESDDNKTRSKIKLLNKEERINEIARILSGDKITKASLDVAKEMLLCTE